MPQYQFIVDVMIAWGVSNIIFRLIHHGSMIKYYLLKMQTDIILNVKEKIPIERDQIPFLGGNK